jgi:hypothetical protein
MQKVAIIGSGATAAATHLGIGESKSGKFEITIFSPPVEMSESNSVESDQTFIKMNTKFLRVNEQSNVVSNLVNSISGAPNFGGWTKFWGATILPWHDKVFARLDLSRDDMHEAYRRIHEIVPLLASQDNLSNHFPLFGVPLPKLENCLVSVFVKNNHASESIVLGNSRLAINGYSEKIEIGCTNCARCLRGCPGDHIWNASIYFKGEFGNLNFINSWVQSLEILYSSNKVRIHYSTPNGDIQFEDFDKIFLAAGALSTAQILIKSGFTQQIVIQDSPVTIVPFVSTNVKRLNQVNEISLSGMFIAMNLDLNSDEHIFMQCYGMSADLKNRVMSEKRILRFIPRAIRNFVLNRVGLAMVFQDMKYGGTIKVCNGSENKIIIGQESERSISGRKNLNISLRRLRKFKILTFWHFRHEGSVGEGFHFGASIRQGQPDDLKFELNLDSLNIPNVHIVDSSVLPAIPCYPTTYTAMANAYLIAKGIAEKLDEDE